MPSQKTRKKADLLPDEFNPGSGAIKSFARVPQGVMEIPRSQLSEGAKLLYGTLVWYNFFDYGASYPTKQELRDFMGNPSLRTLHRWQEQLIELGLIRINIKGRWLPNNYYFRRNGYLENGTPEEIRTVLEAREERRLRRDRKIRAREEAADERRATRVAEWESYNKACEEFNARPEIRMYREDFRRWIEEGKVGTAPVMPDSYVRDIPSMPGADEAYQKYLQDEARKVKKLTKRNEGI